MWTFFKRLQFSGNRAPASPKTSRRGGFTLIELLVVISVMLVLTSIFLFQQQSFDSSTLLRSLTYNVALSIRQAQVYGTSVRETTPGAAIPTFAPAYGVYFNQATPNTYILFADLNNDGLYDAGEDVQPFTISSKFMIRALCAVRPDGQQRCSLDTLDSSGGVTMTQLTVVFKRPNPDGRFFALDSSNAPISGDTYNGAYIELQGVGGATRSITITSTGQISVGAVGT